jgi:predicted NBD/HSP70 family sugar kinase
MFDIAGNDLRVIDLLWRHGTLSRTRLAEMTGLTVPSLSRISQRLISQKIARETAQIREGKRGQPTTLLELNPKACFTLGAAISTDMLSLCLMDFHAQVLGEKFIPHANLAPTKVAEVLEGGFRTLLEECKISRKKVIGAGIALPGNYRHSSRLLHTTPELAEWRDIDISELLQPILGIPVWCDNVGKASAFMEGRFGAGRAFDFFTYIHLGYGIGGGIVLNGQLLQGLERNAASFGSLFPQSKPRPSARDLFHYLQSQGTSISSIEAMATTDIAPDDVRPWVERAAAQISWLVEMNFWITAPEAIVIGGLVPSRIVAALIDVIRPSAEMNAVSLYRSLPPILPATHNCAGPHRGAATLSFQRLMPVSPKCE